MYLDVTDVCLMGYCMEWTFIDMVESHNSYLRPILRHTNRRVEYDLHTQQQFQPFSTNILPTTTKTATTTTTIIAYIITILWTDTLNC